MIRPTLAALCLCATPILLGGCATAPPPAGARPAHWTTPVAAPGVPNLFRVDAALYRSAQPTRDGIAGIDEDARLVNGEPPVKTIVWQNLNRYIEDLDVDAIRAQVAADRN